MKIRLAAALCAAAVMTAGVASAQTFSFTGPPVFIPDNSEVFAPITVTGVPTAGVVTVSIDGTACDTNIGTTTVGIDHTFDADLDIYLQSPSGTRVELSTDNGSGNNNYCQTVFDDAAVTSITAGAAPSPEHSSQKGR